MSLLHGDYVHFIYKVCNGTGWWLITTLISFLITKAVVDEVIGLVNEEDGRYVGHRSSSRRGMLCSGFESVNHPEIIHYYLLDCSINMWLGLRLLCPTGSLPLVLLARLLWHQRLCKFWMFGWKRLITNKLSSPHARVTDASVSNRGYHNLSAMNWVYSIHLDPIHNRVCVSVGRSRY